MMTLHSLIQDSASVPGFAEPIVAAWNNTPQIERLHALEKCVGFMHFGLGCESTQMDVEGQQADCAVIDIARTFLPVCYWLKSKHDPKTVLVVGPSAVAAVFAAVLSTCLHALGEAQWVVTCKSIPDPSASKIVVEVHMSETALSGLWRNGPPALDAPATTEASSPTLPHFVLKFETSAFSHHQEPTTGACKPPSVLVLGLNPAYQKSLQFEKLHVGEVNRASSLAVTCGGKGQHCALAVAKCEAGACRIVQLLGRNGDPGRFVETSMAQAGCQQLIGWFEGTTRTCTTLLCRQSGAMTELIEPSDTVGAECVESTLAAVLGDISAYRGIGLCGTYPPGVGEDFYFQVAKNRLEGTVLLLDGFKGVTAALSTGHVDVLKINTEELFLLLGEPRQEDEGAVVSAAARVFQKGLLSAHSSLALTAGGKRAHVFEGKGTHWQYDIPHVDVVNPIGAGDTCSGVTLYMMACLNMGVGDAFGWGLAAASASCLHMKGAEFSPVDMMVLHSQLKVEHKPWQW